MAGGPGTQNEGRHPVRGCRPFVRELRGLSSQAADSLCPPGAVSVCRLPSRGRTSTSGRCIRARRFPSARGDCGCGWTPGSSWTDVPGRLGRMQGRPGRCWLSEAVIGRPQTAQLAPPVDSACLDPAPDAGMGLRWQGSCRNCMGSDAGSGDRLTCRSCSRPTPSTASSACSSSSTASPLPEQEPTHRQRAEQTSALRLTPAVRRAAWGARHGANGGAGHARGYGMKALMPRSSSSAMGTVPSQATRDQHLLPAQLLLEVPGAQ